MTATNKTLIAIVVGMGVLIILGIGALIAGLIIKASYSPKGKTADNLGNISSNERSNHNAPGIRNINLPGGHRIENVGISRNQIILHTSQEIGLDGLFILDKETGSVIQHFKIEVE